MQGTWVWLADHDLDIPGEAQITVYSGRGILSESQGPVWMIGTACESKVRASVNLTIINSRLFSLLAWTSTSKSPPAEHHVIYQYNLACAKDHYMGLLQTESVCVVYNVILSFDL